MAKPKCTGFYPDHRMLDIGDGCDQCVDCGYLEDRGESADAPREVCPGSPGSEHRMVYSGHGCYKCSHCDEWMIRINPNRIMSLAELELVSDPETVIWSRR